MSFDRLRMRITIGMYLTVLTCLIGGAESLVRKTSGGTVTVPPAPGTIYFYRFTGDWMSMNGDGSGKKVVPISIPSYQRHSGSRWSLGGEYVDGPLDPDGNPPFELFASNESGHVYQLTSDPDIVWTWGVPPTWGKNDSFISFAGVKNTAAGVIGGLFVVEIAWTSGVPVAGPPTLVLPSPIALSTWWGWSQPNLYEHDWSPTGGSVVFTTYDATGAAQLNVASFSGAGAATSHLTSGGNSAWSPDGGRIAFDRGEIWTIKPDGTGAVCLTQSSISKTQQTSQVGPTWSPDGVYLAFTQVLTTLRTSNSSDSVLRIPSGGGSSINLTSGIGNCSSPQWRP
jgi:WD40-like Beta Propeller Repeat